MSTKQLYKKIGIISLIIIIALSTAGAAAYSWWAHQGEPVYSGIRELPGLKDRVTIDYDRSGIPHIKASKESDLYQSLGYVMAQDRLFQMDLLRRVVHGEISEVFGKDALEVDILFRSLGLVYGMQDRIDNGEVDPHLLSLMDSFYKGVNQYIDEGNWSYEYKLLGMSPKKFSAIDGYAILGYMSYSFAQSFKVDLLFSQIKKEKGDDYVNSLRAYPLLKTKKKVTFVDSKRKREGKSLTWVTAHRWLEDNIGMFTGSNAWALGPEKSSSGSSLLASDPHVQFSLPGIWYEAVVDWGNGAFSGLFVPGVPFAAMGHNKYMGWGVTISYIDDMDFYREKIEGDKLYYKGKWLPMEKRHEVIKVKDGEDHEMDLFWGVHGPILENVHPLMEGKLSMKWGHFSEDNQAPMAFYKMMNASDIEHFSLAASLAKSPGLNIVYADSKGHIARYLFGSIPIRPEHMNGDLIYEGESGLYDWLGELPFDEREHIVDPASAMIVSANQRPQMRRGIEYPGYYQGSDRYDTIRAILGAKKEWNLEELKFLQTSNTSIYTLPLRDQILQAFELSNEKQKYKEALDALKNWDGIYDEQSIAASLFQQTLIHVGREFLSPIKEHYLDYCDTNFYSQHIRKRVLRDNAYPELARAFSSSVKFLDDKYGSWEKAKWGELHQLSFMHPLSKGGVLLGKVFNLGPFEVSGAMDTINNLRQVGCRDGLNVKAGPSSRRLIDFSDPLYSKAIVPTGNSGHWKSPFFKNQWPLYKDGKYRDSILKSQLKQESRFSRLELRPRNFKGE